MLFAVEQASWPQRRISNNYLDERALADGSAYRIVKVYYSPRDVEELFRRHGFRVEVTTTPSLWVAAAW